MQQGDEFTLHTPHLVELGFVSHSALSRALAEQYGIEAKTETGFGTGLRAEIERRHHRDREEEIEPHPQISDTAEGCQNSDSALNRGFDTLQGEIDLPITDIVMADMSGEELAEQGAEMALATADRLHLRLQGRGGRRRRVARLRLGSMPRGSGCRC